MQILFKALSYFQNRAHMAQEIGVRYDMLNKYLNNERFPSLRIAKMIEKKTKGEIKALDILLEKTRIKYKQSLEK